jgi:hypothetical protein
MTLKVRRKRLNVVATELVIELVNGTHSYGSVNALLPMKPSSRVNHLVARKK